MASDGSTIWISSVLDREILECRSECRKLAVLPEGLHPFAIAWDDSRDRLWVAADCPPGVPGIKACDRGALIAVDRAGIVRKRITVREGSFHPGDVSASAAGVFASDSQNGAIYRLARAGNLVPVVKSGVGRSGQGTAADNDGKRLLFADYGQGVGVIDLRSGSRTILVRENGKPLRGIDGVARCGGIYYGIYNGSSPGALVAVRPQQAGLSLEQPLGESGLADPTQIAFDGKRLLIVESSGWETVGKESSKRSSGARIVAIPLGRDCKPR